MMLKYEYNRYGIFSLVAAAVLVISCEILDNDPDKHVKDDKDTAAIALNEVACLLSDLPITVSQLQEVYDAVTSSSGNGYDEEYTMKDLFESPGSGVGDEISTKGTYDLALRELIDDYVRSAAYTRSGFPIASLDEMDPDEFLSALTRSDIQIYWPFSEDWDGEEMPVITYDPEDGSEVNIGYKVSIKDDGSRQVEEVLVDEELASEVPVWVVNRNTDAGFTSLEMLRREDPEWGEGGGTIIVKPSDTKTRTGDGSDLRTLILKDFTMKRHYDSWFAGASEFFVKIGSVEDFTASTEAELRLYNPTVTDFMIVVRRKQLGIPQPFNAILVSEWTEQLTQCALMITEDDGGTQTKWDCSAIVKVESKSYGFDISIPYRTRDDVVWRGQLSSKWIEASNNVAGRFGDVELTFEILEY